MSSRTLASLAVAIFLGLVAVLLLRSYINRGAVETPQAPTGMRAVVVAAAPIARGAPIAAEQLKTVNFTPESAPPGSFGSVNEIVVAGQPPKVALRAFGANEALTSNAVSGPGATANLAAQLTPGLRAVGLRSSDVAGVGGFILPGDRVDILVTRNVGTGPAPETIVQVLAENVRVLGVDQSADADKPVVAKAVTVEVTADQAQTISLAQAVGNVTLSLRQFADATPNARSLTTVADFPGRGGATTRVVARRPVAPARPPQPQVRVTRGIEVFGYTLP